MIVKNIRYTLPFGLAAAFLLGGCTASSTNTSQGAAGMGSPIASGDPPRTGSCWSEWMTVLGGHRVESEIRALAQAGCDVEERDYFGRTPLHWAAGAGLVRAARALLVAGADVNARASGGKRPGSGDTPLHWAVTLPDATVIGGTGDPNRLSVVDMLIKAGADVDAKNVAGNTPLHSVFLDGGFDSVTTPAMVERLLDAGANPRAKNNRDRTPFGTERNLQSFLRNLQSVNALKVDR